jgi:hypothetical protein
MGFRPGSRFKGSLGCIHIDRKSLPSVKPATKRNGRQLDMFSINRGVHLIIG